MTMSSPILQTLSSLQMTSIHTPVGNFGTRRIDMPQIRDIEKFIEFIASKEVETEEIAITANALRMTQIEFNEFKVFRMLKVLSDPSKAESISRCIISSDNYILDGTHRFLALYNLSTDSMVRCIRIDKPMAELLPIARTWSGATYYGGQKG